MTEDNRPTNPDVPGEPAQEPLEQASSPAAQPEGPAPQEPVTPPEPAAPRAQHVPEQAPPQYPAEQGPAQQPPVQPQQPAEPIQSAWAAGSAWSAAPTGAAPEQVVYGSAAPGGPGAHAGPGTAGYGAAGLGIPPQGQHPTMGPPLRVGRESPSPRVPEQRRGGAGLVAGVAVLALLVGGGAGAVGGYLVSESNANSAPVSNALDEPPPAKQTSNAPAGSVEAVAEKVLPSVVQLQVQGRSSAGEGSGFVISSDGLILTNNHVVEAAAGGGQITAVFPDGSTADAQIVGRDPTSDLAVVRAEGKSGLPVVELGRSDDLRVGEGVVAIGSPFELTGTVTSGIVSSLHRPTRAGDDGSQATVLDAIQTDAAINPGNSGGPLLNMQGQVVGINSVIYSPPSNGQSQPGNVGIGFAIPIDQARRTADEIVETGQATQTVLGVTVRDNEDGGALIMEVTPGGPGEQAGLAQGDVITKLDDRRIDTSDALVAAVRSHAPGDKVQLEIGNGSRTVEATLAGQPVETE